MMSKILIPSAGPDSWSALLADKAHWRTGYSARSLAYCWEDSSGDFPPEIRALLGTSPLFAHAELVLAIPEHKVTMPGAGRQSQTDLWALARTDDGLVSVAVEGKVSETFGPTIREWLSDESSNKKVRLAGICELLGIDHAPDDLRYQLFHRTASAILEARRLMASHAVMLVHSFSQSDEWYADFASFVRALGGVPEAGHLSTIPNRNGPSLHLGWARGEERFLRA